MKAAKRRSLKPSQFAEPKDRKYPVDTVGRARNAPARAAAQANEGNISRGEEKKIDAKAHRALDRMEGKRRR